MKTFTRPLLKSFQLDVEAPDQVLPYGMYRHGQVFIDVSPATAAIMAEMFVHPGRHVDEYPWYIGHPDDKAWADLFRDHTAYGYIEDVRPEDDGVHLRVEWTIKGRELIDTDAFRHWSPRFGYRATGRRHEGLPVVEPVFIKSAGFTHEPAIPHLSVACQASDLEAILTQEKNMSLLEKLRARFKKPEATEDELVTDVSQLETVACQVTSAEARATTAEAALKLANDRIGELATGKTASDEALTLACQRIRGYHEARGEELLTVACQDMRVLPADEADWKAKFSTEDPEVFTLACQALGNLTPTVKTESESGDLGERKAADLSNREQIKTLVCQERKRLEDDEGITSDRSYDVAWANVAKTHPELPM